ncbi:hypothetical protein JOD54_004989 [Actinokineospora baliensis]|uniref:hypothetical protein n=1 Tax=Actinokineospora baliensis TaxID=547056 RepID=UPI00195691E6|nr:hypothetical protein [Actinokineospora baliensis]MBM7774785.1 hypothetical protein [Actinokineospora baliensis]
MRDDEVPVDETVDGAATPEGGEPHPAGRIRLSPGRAIGMRVSALGGLAIGAMAVTAPAFSLVHPTSGP